VGVRPYGTLWRRIKIQIIYDPERAGQEEIQPSFDLSSEDDYMKVEVQAFGAAV
jgi:hypothetical protein